MNQDTEKNINEAIDWLQQTGGQIQDFAVEQAPLYCREVVAWELGIGIAMSISALICILVVIYAWKVSFRWHQDEKIKAAEAKYYLTSDTFIGPLIAGILFAAGSILLLAAGVPRAVKAAVAPRLVIVEHLRGLNK